jgi:putative polyhydroxyalkanoate system protein
MIHVQRHHDMGLAAAKGLAETMARRLQADHGGTYSWKDNELVFRRPGASGRVAVTKNDVDVTVDLGFLLTPLRSRIERETRTFFDEHLGGDERSDGGSSDTAIPPKRRRGPSKPPRR